MDNLNFIDDAFAEKLFGKDFVKKGRTDYRKKWAKRFFPAFGLALLVLFGVSKFIPVSFAEATAVVALYYVISLRIETLIQSGK